MCPNVWSPAHINTVHNDSLCKVVQFPGLFTDSEPVIHESRIFEAMSSSIQKMDSVSAGTAVALEWTDGKKQLDHEQARQLAAEYDPCSPEEKQLVRKLDWRLVVS